MPVLLKSTDVPSAVFSGLDMDHLISDVRERLCIKSHPERLCSASARRSAPYQLSKRPFPSMCEQCRNKHYSSPNSCIMYKSHAAISSKSEPCCSLGHRKMCSKKTANPSQCGRDRDPSYQDDPHVLLEKLLAEQSLIQEAVRRLQTRNSREKMCSAQKLFSLVSDVEDEDSNDQFSSRQTPFSVTMSESEDDAVSQHSIDL